VSSEVHKPRKGGRAAPKMKFTKEDWNDPNQFNDGDRYSSTKLANIMWMHQLSRKLENSGITVCSLSPGFIPSTGLARNYGWFKWVLMKAVFVWLPFTKSIDHGANAILHCSNDSNIKNGKYYANLKEDETSVDSKNQENQEKLWKLCCDLTDIKEF